MTPELIKLLIVTIGTVIALPVVVAAMRVFFAAGKLLGALDMVRATAERAERKIDAFIETAQQLLNDHDARILTIETERRMEARAYGRRVNDQPGEVP